MPRVSIVVPLYNKAPYVLRSLESIAAQTVTDLDVIVVDDGSTDGGADLVANFSDPRFRLIRQANAGPGAARNRGLVETCAPYVAFLDADDCWLPNFIEENLTLFERHPAAAAVSSGWLDPRNGASRREAWIARGVEEGLVALTPDTAPQRLFTMLGYMNPSTVLARSASIRRWGGFYERHCLYGEDTTLWLKTFLNEPFVFTLRVFTKIDVEASQLCRNYTRARPIEPFLLDPSILRDACPQTLRPLLERLLKIFACKTAAVLGFWGEWRQARQLVWRFISPSDWRTPLFPTAMLSSSPLVTPVAWLARSFVKR
jgi:glycosyltransferase involved in cell wall biosynthesis